MPDWLQLIVAMILTALVSAGGAAAIRFLNDRLQGAKRIAAITQVTLCTAGGVYLIVINWLHTMAPLAILSMATGVILGILFYTRQTSQAEIRKVNAELRHLQRQLTEAQIQLIKEDETDRRLLAGDLHDQILNDLKLLRQRMHDASKNGDAAERLTELQSDLGKSMSAIREVMESLFPSTLETLGLVAAIEQCLNNAATRAQFESNIRDKTTGAPMESMPKIERLLLYRLIQESVTNIVKHAEATKVSCIFTEENGNLIIRVTDNGKGLPEPSASSGESRGLKYMKQRAALIGATINWLPNPKGNGTQVEISKPQKTPV